MALWASCYVSDNAKNTCRGFDTTELHDHAKLYKSLYILLIFCAFSFNFFVFYQQVDLRWVPGNSEENRSSYPYARRTRRLKWGGFSE